MSIYEFQFWEFMSNLFKTKNETVQRIFFSFFFLSFLFFVVAYRRIPVNFFYRFWAVNEQDKWLKQEKVFQCSNEQGVSFKIKLEASEA